MLHSYAFSNFQSFIERTEVSLRLNEKAAVRGWEASSSAGQRLTLAMATLGPNGAGKTGLLKPLAFLTWFVRSSFRSLKPDDPIPFEPHFACASELSEFEVEAEDGDGVLWRYVLRASNKRVHHEALYRKKERFGYVFVRDWDEQRSTYAIKQQDFGLSSAEALKVRGNASLISTAVQYDVPLAKKIASFKVCTNINANGRESYSDDKLVRAAEFFAGNETLQAQMKTLIRSWDMGLEDVNLSQLSVPAQAPGGKEGKVWYPFGVHKARGKVARLPFAFESQGTRAALILLSILLAALEEGGIALVDEFENDLHPKMLEPILDLFSNPETNPRNAQIIFTCHTVEILNMLHKGQVTLVEKEKSESRAWRLDTMQGVRSDDNLYAKYMAGAYGAVPRVS